jgi:hypothetical protein
MDFQQNTSHQLSACRDSEEPGRRKEAGGGGSRDLGSSCPSALLAMGLSVSGMGRPEGSTMEANGSQDTSGSADSQHDTGKMFISGLSW